LSANALAEFLTGQGLPQRLGCRHFGNGDVSTCSHCGQIVRELVDYLLQRFFTVQQLEAIKDHQRPRLVSAIIEAVLARSNGREGKRDG